MENIRLMRFAKGKHLSFLMSLYCSFFFKCRVLMPGKLKRKLPTVRKGPTPKWDIPLRWENIRRKDLPNTSLEISIWCQERFRKPMIGSIQLHSTSAPSDSKVAKGSSTLKTEISVWETFLKDPTTVHHCRLPLRSTTQEK